jgi:hypothetical protein
LLQSAQLIRAMVRFSLRGFKRRDGQLCVSLIWINPDVVLGPHRISAFISTNLFIHGTCGCLVQPAESTLCEYGPMRRDAKCFAAAGFDRSYSWRRHS